MIEVPPGVRIPAWVRAASEGDRIDPVAFGATLGTLHRLPKVELHLHLEGSLRPETVRELASRYEPDSPLGRPGWQDGYWSFSDLAGFVVELGRVIRACARAPEDYYQIAHDCFEDLAAQKVRYAEVSFSPRTDGRPFYVPFEDTLVAIDKARRDVEGRTDLRVGLLVSLGRHHAAQDGEGAEAHALALVERTIRGRDGGAAVVGIDLHGDEQAYPRVAPFVRAFSAAKEAGLGLRAHAGEGTGAATVWDTIRQLGVQRLGHGVRAIEVPALVRHLAGARIALDLCPTSNVRTGIAASIEEHPIRALHEAGVILTIGSDDPGVFDSTITTELALLHHRLGFTFAELGQLTTQAAAHSFLPEPERDALVAAIAAAWAAGDDATVDRHRP